MKLSPGLSRLSGVILSGMLLTGNVLAPSTSQTLSASPLLAPVSLADYSGPASVPRFLHQQSQANVGTKVMATTKEADPTPTNNNQNESSSPGNSTQPVQIAQASPSKTQPAEKVSRGSSSFSEMIDHALSLVGTPYVFGGTSRTGFDCSGFTQYIYSGSGISLPRTSYAQYASGVAVSKDELQPGDLVFFTTYSKGASHVGIYIGGGRFVHADNPRVGVTITNLSNSFYTSHYLGARRYG
ncbi:C40 family peptidase [Desulfosporosinus sp. PR]|uniref:C40 family peptidase n=1 Tax=Candidatus Desulfosporosinus nitrosoreducens TaxID=3401928 RepID=UPI0027ED66E5|nr:C40 family peptidase [Desulfosporosinus sp. PR]MDQ7093402.1 C40 family peptidase [Desulfosporosinus sp. PR]